MAFRNEGFEKVIYLAHGGAGNGESAADPLPLSDGALMNAPADMVVTGCDVVITTAVTGTTALTVGDGADPDGFVAAVDVTLGTPAVYNGAGAALSKHYTAADTIDLDVTGTSTAGACAVVVKGYMI